ncbi:hypothetical protein BDQ17DRAFT_1380776 [Cyathus striatus]|nr:hypothetical protein BDQ17DRAFT_1380776 [Cyathus striatus]
MNLGSNMDLNNDDLISFIQTIWRQVRFAAITSLVYDIIYNFTEEWHEMVIPKIIYIIARYSSLFYLLSANIFRSPIQNRYAEVSHHVRHLKLFFRLTTATCQIGAYVPVGSVDLIFILRVCALYGNSKGSTTYHNVFQVSLIFSALVSIAYSKSAVAIPSIGCVGFIPHFLTKQQTTFYVVTLTLHTTLFLLTFFRVGRDFIRDSGGLRNAIMRRKAGVSKETPLTTLILHDGTLYFFILFGSTLIASVGSALQLNTFLNFINPQCNYINDGDQGSRLILKLRQMHDTEINECTPAVSPSIFFTEPGGADSSLEASREYRRRGGVR